MSCGTERLPMQNGKMERMMKSINECPTGVEGVVKGVIPHHLQGSLIRLGPAKWDLHDGFTLNSWLDGCAMMIKFDISPGRVLFSSRFLESDAYRKMMSHGKPVYTEFGTRSYPDKDKNIFSRIVNQIVPSDLTDNDISNIFKIKDEFYVATESCNIWKIDSETLESKNKVNLDKCAKISVASSHPQYSEKDNSYYNIGTTFLTGMKYHILKVPLTGDNKTPSKSGDTVFKKASIVTSIPSSHKTAFGYIHSFFMSENFIVIPEQPLMANGLKVATCTVKGKSLKECLEWYPDEPTRLHVIEKSTGNVSKVKYHTNAFYFFHTVNAYEEGNHLVLDICTFKDPSCLDNYNLDRMRRSEWNEDCPPVPKRFVLPLGDFERAPVGENLVNLPGSQARAEKLDSGVIWLHPETLGSSGWDVPRINDKCLGKFYRYIYGSAGFERGNYERSVVKTDLKSKCVTTWRDEKSETAYPGEPVFVARPGAIDEDDGHLLAVVIESDETKPHFLVILDAKTLKEECRVEYSRDKCEVPCTIHGIFQHDAHALVSTNGVTNGTSNGTRNGSLNGKSNGYH